jgi:hypothetical protein
MAEEFGLVLVGLGMAFKVLIRAPYTDQKERFSFMRCTAIYLRFVLLLVYFNPDFKHSELAIYLIRFIVSFTFPFYSLVTYAGKEYNTNFIFLVALNAFYILSMLCARTLYKGFIRLKFSIYIVEVVTPDIILYLVYNFLEFSSFHSYLQILGFFVTISLYCSLCIGAPIVIMYDIEIYKNAKLMFTGIKKIRKEWYWIFRHYVTKIQELVLILTLYFNALWLDKHPYSVFYSQKAMVLGFILFIFMRLQKTYWPYFFRRDNLFMDKAYLALIISTGLDSNLYLLLVITLPFISYIELPDFLNFTDKKKIN